MNATHKKITLITGNEGKVREFERLLGTELDHQKIKLPEEIANTDVRVVARKKAEDAYEQLGRACLVDDTGLTIHAWGELPGAYIRAFLDNGGNEGIIKKMSAYTEREATVTTALGYCDENGSRVFSGEVHGTIAPEPRGNNGFGYDAIFIPEGQPNTYAQMTDEEKDHFSMRARAAQAMLKELQL